jgi:hypothetical protein
MISGEFKKEDYWLIKWSLLSFVLSLVISGGLLVGLNALDAAATTDLRRARASLDQARSDVDTIEQEEATIIEYVGRYQQMEQDGEVAAEDRLQFNETLREIRDQFNLFPIGVNMDMQTSLPLRHSEGNTERGREVVLHTSLVRLMLPLLHEDDLARLLVSVMEGPGLLQPLTCSLSANSNRPDTLIYLAQHFSAECALNWYTFELPPVIEARP